MQNPRLLLPTIAAVAACLLTSRPLAAGPYHVPGITSAYTLVPQSGICEQRIQRIERTLEQIAKKVGVEVEPPIVTIHSTRLITRVDGVTVLDESCLPDSSTAVLDIIKQSEPAERAAAAELETLEKRRIELLGQMLNAFEELRATDAKIERIKERTLTPQ
jgi:predicted RecB family endonuclease